MTDTLLYIDDYFQQQLPETERQIFEKRCEEDTAFAAEVASYISVRMALKQELLQKKQTAWSNENVTETIPVVPINTAKKIVTTQWLYYAAAACLLITISVYFFTKKPLPQQLSADYINKNFMQLSQSMNGANDSLQLGMAAYNKKDYNQALPIFENIYKNHPEKTDAKKYAGYVSLITKQYDKALQQFQSLADIEGLYSNPGLFLKAITLLQRNNEDDATQAKEILKQVIQKNLKGKQEAEVWLTKM